MKIFAEFHLHLIRLTLALILLGCSSSAVSLNWNPKVKFHLSGLEGKILNLVTEHLTAKFANLSQQDETQVAEFYASVPTEVTELLKLYGYFRAEVRGQGLVKRGRCYKLFFTVQKGRPVIIRSIEFKLLGSGRSDQNLVEALDLKLLPIRSGDPLITTNYYEAKNLLFNIADRYGYYQARLTYNVIKLDLAQGRADIILHLDTGERYHFGETQLVTDFFSPKFLARFLRYRPGDLYSNAALNTIYDDFHNSPFFQSVKIEAKPSTAHAQEVLVQVKVEPRKPHKYLLGLGYGTDTGVRGSLGGEIKYLTPSCHSLAAQTQVAENHQNLDINYLIPGQQPALDTYDLNFKLESINLKKGTGTYGSLGLAYLTKLHNWQQKLGLNLYHEHYQLTGESAQTARMVLANANWLYSYKDDLLKPNRGLTVNLNLLGASKYTVASHNFLQSSLKLKSIYPLSSKTQLLFNGMVGLTFIRDINQLPLSLQLYAGGTQSIRGFGYNTLGPGTKLVMSSVTMRQQIIPDLYLELFFDAGRVGHSLKGSFARSLGCGVVWRTALGSFELTFAKALSQKGVPGMIQFSMGPEL